VVEKIAVEQVSFRVLRLSPVNIILPITSTHRLHGTEEKAAEFWKSYRKEMFFRKLWFIG